MDVRIRTMRQEDVETCGRICYEAFKTIAEQHNFPPDFPSPEAATELLSYLLARGDIYSVVAEAEGRIAGSNFLWEAADIAGVGPITIDPSVQNGSIGKRLMNDVMCRAEERRYAGVRLVQAAYHNRSLSLYTKLGFYTREPLSVMQGEPLGIAIQGHEVRAAAKGDVEECNKLYQRVHGHERRVELVEAINQGAAMVVEHSGRITGYATQIGFIGHAVAESNEDMKALIGAARSFDGPGFLLPTRNHALFSWCLEKGLRVVMPMTLMSTGLYNEPGGAYLPSVIY